MENLEIQIDRLCEKLDLVSDDAERKMLEAEIFSLVEKLNGNTIYLTLH